MGTSATLAVRYEGRTFIQYASHDASPSNVFAEMLSSLSAMGVDTLREAIARQPDPETIPTDFERLIDIRSAGNAYIEACQARGKEPFGLVDAINYEYGNSDFSHGGAIALLAPEVDWHKDQCSGIEDASFILDLDKNLLAQVNHDQYKPGDYDRGAVKFFSSVSLDGIEKLDPEQVFSHFSYSGMNHSAQSQERATAAMNDLLAGKRIQTAKERYEEYMATNPHAFQRSLHKYEPEAAVPAIYQLSGTLNHIFHFQAVLGLLREKASEFPSLGEEGTLLRSLSEDDTPQGPITIQTLFVDLRKEVDPKVHQLVEIAMGCFRQEGMVYVRTSPNSSYGRNPFAIFSSASIRMDEDASDTTNWDDDIIPVDAEGVGPYEEFDEKIDQALAEGNAEKILHYYLYSLVDMNQSRLDKIENAGVSNFDIKSYLEAAHTYSILPVARVLGLALEKDFPGTLAQRYNRLSEKNKERFLSAMTPVDVYMFEQLLQQSQDALDKASPRRSPRLGV